MSVSMKIYANLDQLWYHLLSSERPTNLKFPPLYDCVEFFDLYRWIRFVVYPFAFWKVVLDF
ncbi:hypothetical protein FK85_00345 [Halorubrum saccharovorum]|uniref:Uncharacterized protein n=1 Tax=Halorubrum saccharovorum TaxID=2248 RepID=A0A081EW19_9EURY|nr:hypothetical protein FK85_00345 [Halorubrum saccharovorum]